MTIAVAAFTIPVTSLDAGGTEYRFPIRAGWLDEVLTDSGIKAGRGTEAKSDPEAEIGELAIRASKSGEDVIVHGRIKATLTAECARCTNPAVLDVDQPVTALLVPASTAKAKQHGTDYEFSAEEADTLTYQGENVVLDDMVRDELLLEVPMIPLCSEDCAGINPGSALGVGSRGTPVEQMDENNGIDPRLAPLLKLKLPK